MSMDKIWDGPAVYTIHDMAGFAIGSSMPAPGDQNGHPSREH